MFNLLTEAAAGSGTMGSLLMILYVVFFVVIIYFMMIRPQKKDEKRKAAMRSAMKVGDAVVTQSGFYGVLIAVTDDDCIVEFGNNKNCRIPMRKEAIAEVESADSGTAEETK